MGDYVELDEPICEFESDKATLEFPAEAAGKLIYVAAEGDDLEIGALVAKIDTSVASPSGSAKEEAPAATEPSTSSSSSAPVAEESTNYATGHPSPAAGKILREGNVDPSSVTGTGKDGRITKTDAENAVQNKAQATPAKTEEAPVANHIPIEAFSRNDRREKLSRMRRTIASRLVDAKNNSAMLTTFNEAAYVLPFSNLEKHTRKSL